MYRRARAQHPLPPRFHIRCGVCETWVHPDAWERHPASKTHRQRTRTAAVEVSLEHTAQNNYGVVVSHHQTGLDFGVVDIASASAGVSAALTIRSVTPQPNIKILSATLASQIAGRTSSFVVAPLSNHVLDAADSLDIDVKFMREHRGFYLDRLELMFEDTRLQKRFVVTRIVQAIVGDPPEYRDMQSAAPYVPQTRVTRDPETEVIPGVPPPALKAIPYIGRLPDAPMPEHMVRALTSRMSIEGKSKLFENIFLPRNLDQKSYSGHFKALLWAEEFRCDQDLQTYDIADATLNNFNSYYYLAVPGLAERRPSVLVGDRILIQPIGSDLQRGKWFEGRVHVVRKEEVGMKFHDSFHAAHTPTRRYRARFKLNRHSLQRQHQALDATFTPPRILFPATSSGVTIPPVAKIRPSVYNELITHNPAQLQAVSSIVHMLPKSPPFVVFGPPGTGKTMTIIESIRQILDGNANTRVLACAPSNSAADLIAQGLKMYRPDQLFRFYAPSRSKADVPTELQRHIVVTPDGHFSVPAIAALKKYRVIVTTCVSASFAHGVGIPKGHFSHIFVDEAGQATEPEVMIAIKTMANDSTNIVLSGDPKQLGPIVRSAVSRTHGLEKSYLERLMNNKTYDIQNGHGTTVVKLIKNFRSNEHILDFPNRQFYDAALQPCANRRIIDCFVGSPILVNKEFPVVFHALSGKDDREARSPSFFNILEAQQVKDYVMRLRSDRNVQISDKDIGIITPYHAQCLKIRSILRPFAEGIKVGSVEEFQGQERLVIIISTVRSSREFIEYDLRHTLGFVANPRRLNVAITRAKSLLIVVGDPSVLSLDPLWRSFLDYVHLNGGWRGEEPGWDTRVRVRENGGYDKKVRATASADMNEFVRRMETLTLDNATQEEGEMSEEEDNVDRPWHRDEME